ncbi:mono-functional DNA-alkylating methyl methanesulfonate N-term-domain-containing protein [Coniochaeta sp. 2T2.1]|nr:mono-functional DNA-alkylating methyl methanesulfonate N-term-domain-containing protein [Coniochaeta sp. 2T2.1]
MAYIAPIHRASSVRHALHIRLLSVDEDSLVLAKANRLEIWRVAGGALTMVHSKAVFGTITMLQKLRPRDTPTELLFVGTERQQFFTVAWDPEQNDLQTMQVMIDVGEKLMRDSQTQDRALVDPSGRFLSLHLWEGVLDIYQLPNRKGAKANSLRTLQQMEQVRLSELFIKSSTFMYTDDGHPKIAFLYQTDTETQDSQLAVYRLTSDDLDNKASRFDPVRDKDKEMSWDFPDPGAAMLIPIRKVEEENKRHNVRNPTQPKAHLGGLVLVGETRLLYVDGVTKVKIEKPLQQATIFVAWAEYDAKHYFLGDDYGQLWFLSLVCELDSVVVKSLSIEKIGRTSRASELVYLGNDLLFVASHYGDSQLYKLDLASEKGEFCALVQVLPNIGPILDFAVMDMGNREREGGEGQIQVGSAYSSGQARIVTGSGVYKDGSLRSVRSGVGLDDIGILADLEDVRGLFPIRSDRAEKVDTLLVSFLTETRIFHFEPSGGVEELDDFKGFAFDHQTLYARSIAGGRLLQVTTVGVVLSDGESGVQISSWSPGEGKTITNASANEKWLLLSVDGTSLLSFELHQLELSAETSISDKDQIACVHVAPAMEDVGVVGTWASATVTLINMSNLQAIHGTNLRRTDDEASIPRDLALVQVLPPATSGPTLFVSMEDGNVHTFNVAPEDLSLSGRKTVVLGTRQASFQLLPQPSGVYNIFATSEHSSLIHGSEGRIVYSAVTAEDAVCACPFDTIAFPGCIALATESQIKIAQIDEERRTHVRPLEMGETIRRMAYSPSEKVFGLGCIKRSLVQGEEIIQSSFRLVDDVIFTSVGKPFLLNAYGSVVELVESVVRAELPDAYGNPVERFVVGTSFLTDPESDRQASQVAGRILVLGVDSDRSPYLILSHELKGPCRCLAIMGNKIVAALAKTVIVSNYEEASNTSGRLVRLASYRPATYPIDLAVDGNMIAVSDLQKSVTLVEYVPAEGQNPAQLVQRARHHQSIWSTAVAHVEGDFWLEADAQGNLVVLRYNRDGVTEDQKQRLELTSELSLGEMVNRIRAISVETSPNAVMVPKAFLGTVEGAIYMFGTIAPDSLDLLMRFQSKLAPFVRAPGIMDNNDENSSVDFNTYRSFRNAEREGDAPFRFVDGELIERFLDVDEKTQEQICEGLGPNVEAMRNMIEELRRMH